MIKKFEQELNNQIRTHHDVADLLDWIVGKMENIRPTETAINQYGHVHSMENEGANENWKSYIIEVANLAEKISYII